MTITFSQLAGDIKVPTIAVETDLESGRTGLPSRDKRILCVGYPTAAGSATANKLYQVRDTKKAIELFGIGSQLAVMVDKILGYSSLLDVWAFPIAEAAGTPASGTITVATAATGAGTVTARIGGRTYRAGVQTDDTADDIGEAIEAVINADPNAPFTASNALGTVTVTARNDGVAGNSIGLACEITAGIGTTVTAGAATLGSGATDSDPTTPLVELQGHRFHIVCSAFSDATGLGAVEDHVTLLADALKQKWGMAIAAANGTQAAAISLAAGIDAYRAELAHLEGCPNPSFEIAAVYAAARAYEVNRNLPLNGVVLKGLRVPEDKTDWPTDAALDTALSSGVSPLRPLPNGDVQIVRTIHTRVTTPAFIDVQPLEISDYVDEDLIAVAKARYSRAVLKSLSPAGTPDTLTPGIFVGLLAERMLIWDAIDYVQGSRDIIEQTDLGKQLGAAEAEVNASDPNRLDVGYPFVPTWGAHVIAIKKTLTLPPISVG